MLSSSLRRHTGSYCKTPRIVGDSAGAGWCAACGEVSQGPKEADTMTRRLLPAWLLLAFMAFSAMMPAVANAQPNSNRARSVENVQRRVDNRAYANTNAYANSNQRDRNTVQA